MSKTRLTPQIDLDGISPDEAFSILGNEIRLDIIRVLWEAGAANQYDDVCSAAATMSFTDLRRHVDIRDNGKFNYHVSKLTPHFVRRTDDGYRLSGAGKRIARTVIAVSGADDVDVSETLDTPCPLCDSPMTATYEDQWFRVECTGCEGLFGDELPDGAVYLANYPSAGLASRTPEEALETGLFRCLLDQAYLMQGVCRECAGPVSTTLSVCDDHAPGSGHCDACGTRSPVWADQRCDTCGFAKRLPIEICTMGLTPVIGFLDERGYDVLEPTFEDLVELLEERFEASVNRDPFYVTVSVEGGVDSLRVALDERMNVIEIDRPRPAPAD
jgi:hypothetical protein